jgi:hypothetical protein
MARATIPTLFKSRIGLQDAKSRAKDLCLGLGLGGALDATRVGTVQVLGRNPALVVRLGAASDSGAISADNSNLLGRINLLGATGRLLRALATLSAATLLREKGGDPRVVDEIGSSGEGSDEDEVEEDSASARVSCLWVAGETV